MPKVISERLSNPTKGYIFCRFWPKFTSRVPYHAINQVDDGTCVLAIKRHLLNLVQGYRAAFTPLERKARRQAEREALVGFADHGEASITPRQAPDVLHPQLFSRLKLPLNVGRTIDSASFGVRLPAVLLNYRRLGVRLSALMAGEGWRPPSKLMQLVRLAAWADWLDRSHEHFDGALLERIGLVSPTVWVAELADDSVVENLMERLNEATSTMPFGARRFNARFGFVANESLSADDIRIARRAIYLLREQEPAQGFAAWIIDDLERINRIIELEIEAHSFVELAGVASPTQTTSMQDHTSTPDDKESLASDHDGLLLGSEETPADGPYRHLEWVHAGIVIAEKMQPRQHKLASYLYQRIDRKVPLADLMRGEDRVFQDAADDSMLRQARSVRKWFKDRSIPLQVECSKREGYMVMTRVNVGVEESGK